MGWTILGVVMVFLGVGVIFNEENPFIKLLGTAMFVSGALVALGY